MRSNPIFKIVFAVLMVTGSSVFAKVGFNLIDDVKPAVIKLFVTEDITKDDAADVKKMSAMMDKRYGTAWHILVDLNSSGGSITAALEIGRLLRKMGSMAFVSTNAICMSSCVYILAGADHRAVDGKVGIHRPYEPESTETSKEIQKAKYRKLEVQIKEYLAEMNIPLKLYDDQLFISPESIRVLTDRELQEYGLNKNDPFAEEADAAKEAKKLGITRLEYAERTASANRRCPFTGDRSKDAIVSLLNCRRKIVSGV